MATTDFARARLDATIDLRLPLAVQATRMPLAQIELNLAPFFAQRTLAGRTVKSADLFGTALSVAFTGISPAGRPRLPLSLLVALLYLKQSYNLSYDAVGVGRVHLIL